MARPKLDRVRTHINIEKDTFAELEMVLLDPVKGGLRYGALSEVANKLLRQFLDNMRKPGVDPIKYLEAYGVKPDA